ncbi:MAG: hypothetical protein PHV06_05480, partial [bacterium]|nr:hypothetical protein [bacterium]
MKVIFSLVSVNQGNSIHFLMGELVLGIYFLLLFEYSELLGMNRVANLILLVIFISAAYGMLQKFNLDPFNWQDFGSRRVISFFANPNLFAAFLCGVFPVVLYIILRRYQPDEFRLKSIRFEEENFSGIIFSGRPLYSLISSKNRNINSFYLKVSGHIKEEELASFSNMEKNEYPLLSNVNIFSGLTAILVLSALLFTQTRAGFLGFASGIIYIFIVNIFRKRKIFTFHQVKPVALIILILVSLIIILNPDFFRMHLSR